MAIKIASVLLLFALTNTACQPAQEPAETDASSSSDSTDFAYCPPAKFANCTLAKCERTSDGTYTCWCFEDDRYSATAWAGSQSASCKAATPTELQSRYHPIAAYQECDSSAPVQEWAWCLGVHCAPSTNPENQDSTANVRCDCQAIPASVPPVPYVVTTNTYRAENCAFEYWSSATPSSLGEVTSFLQKQPGLGNLSPPVVVEPPE